ncbi:uncharacterized protein L201_006023 [Kwoniella dendrophila CBS 6074]|uniref:Uncharacterized protein n=1 Tax=Kwoniella dendrophila CBS 6074 TaxID=1295534 RepID=A0AAX4K0F3_9TREE
MPLFKSDPSGTVVKRAFLIESFFNLLSFPLITNTETVLYYLLRDPTSQINASSILFSRLFGGLVIGGLTTCLIYGSKHIPSRRNVYWTLGMGEIFLIPILLLEALKSNQDKNKALSTYTALGSISLLLPPLLWRVYILYIRPDLIGDENQIKKDERQPLIRDEQ